MRKINLRRYMPFPLLLLVLWGCAAQQVQKQATPWHCSPEADEAFKHGDWRKALTGHERVLASEPRNCLALYHLGYIMGHLANRHKEIELYRQSVDCGYASDDQLFFNLGMALGDLGDLAAAKDALRTAVSLNPGYADNYFGLGLVSQLDGGSDEARKAFEQAIRLAPDHWEAHLALARLLLDLELWDQAALHIDAVLASDPSNADALDLREILESRKAMQYR